MLTYNCFAVSKGRSYDYFLGEFVSCSFSMPALNLLKVNRQLFLHRFVYLPFLNSYVKFLNQIELGVELFCIFCFNFMNKIIPVVILLCLADHQMFRISNYYSTLKTN